MHFFPLPRFADDVTPCRSADPLSEIEDGVDVCPEMSTAVPAEDELFGVNVDVLIADAVIRPLAPSLELAKRR